MSIASEITRLQSAKANIKGSIEGKGVTVPSSATLDEYSGYIDDIPTGGTPVINPLSVTENGTYTVPSGVDGYSPVVVSVSGGGGGSAVEENDVNFYDYDGTCVTSYSAADFAELTAMPENPSHTGLTSQGWNWSLADAKTYVAKYGILDIGQMYVTDDDTTRIYIHLSDERKSPMVGVGVNGTVDIDWGDGTAHDTLTGTSLYTTKYTPSHEYATGGDYVIKLTVTGKIYVAGSTSEDGSITILRHSSSSDRRNRYYAAAITKIEIGSDVNLSTYAFSYCYSLRNVIIPSSVSTIPNGLFYYCYGLTAFIIPHGVTSIAGTSFYSCSALSVVSTPNTITNIGASSFYYAYNFRRITMPASATTIGNYLFTDCHMLKQATIPDGVTSIGQYCFQNCNSITKLVVPGRVTSILNGAFYGCGGMAECHLEPTSPPTLGSSVFSNVPSDCKIYVPYSADHSILAAYQSATNWSTYASMMVEEEP